MLYIIIFTCIYEHILIIYKNIIPSLIPHRQTLMAVLTRCLVHALLHRVLLLMDPFAVALEVDLRGRRGLAVQVDGLVLDDVRLLWLHQKVRERLGRVRGERLREFAQSQIVVIYRGSRRWEGVSLKHIRGCFIEIVRVHVFAREAVSYCSRQLKRNRPRHSSWRDCNQTQIVHGRKKIYIPPGMK